MDDRGGYRTNKYDKKEKRLSSVLFSTKDNRELNIGNDRLV